MEPRRVSIVLYLQKFLLWKLHVHPGASQKFCKARAVLYALTQSIEKEIGRLEHLNITGKVNHSEWVATVVPVLREYKVVW